MRRIGLLALAVVMFWQPCCIARGKSSQHGSLGKTNFVTADNGLGFVAMEHLTEYLAKLAIHVAGMDPPVAWVPYPTNAAIFPDWLDEPGARPASIMALGQPRCGESDFARLAARLKDISPAPGPIPHQEGLIRLESPETSISPPPGNAAGENGLDIRSIYRRECVIPAG